MATEYSIEEGFFIQDHGSSATNNFPLPDRFGLVDDSPERWSTLLSKLKQLNDDAPLETSYKLLFAGRHGEGWHNVAMAKYSSEEWNGHLAAQTGDGTLTWGPDPELTAIGRDQAMYANAMWKQELAAQIPLPTKFFCSPLSRALETCIITFDPLLDFASQPAERRPLVVENCRERIGVSTCDQRRSKSYILSQYGSKVDIEADFSEEDIVFKPQERETYEHLSERARAFLDLAFLHEDLVVSVTAHNGWINRLIIVTGHAPYDLPTGGVLPMVIKCVRK